MKDPSKNIGLDNCIKYGGTSMYDLGQAISVNTQDDLVTAMGLLERDRQKEVCEIDSAHLSAQQPPKFTSAEDLKKKIRIMEVPKIKL